ncbi:MAG TPA: L,D-transpeptidase family protein [Acidimicrobiales bacterium]|nr:L,D-transpeptidase family protein [Acidimicrobiales bacterium]
MKWTAVSRRWVAVAGALVLGLTACSHDDPRMTRTAAAAPTTTTESTTTTTATTIPPTTAKAAPPLPGLGRGARGPEVQTLEQRLAEMHYDVGAVDGYFDSMTVNAVIAFQKVERLARTGRATDDVFERLKIASTPPAMVPGGGAKRVEVDITRQILYLFEGDALYRIIPVSTGSGKRYCVDGECAYAVTPGGSFRITWRVKGWHTSRLGKLYNPLFFNGGIAIHGATSVPTYPASHGCVRVPLSAAEWLPSHLPKDTPVYVLNGKAAPVPFNEPAPNGAPPSSVPETTTTSPPTTMGFPFNNNTTTSSTPPPPP